MSVEVPPPPILFRLWPFLVQFVNRLNMIDVGPSLRVSSWWRDVETNRRVGGHPESQHLLGLAIDVVGDPFERQLLLAQLGQFGLVGVDEGSHLHVQALPAGRARVLGFFSD